MLRKRLLKFIVIGVCATLLHVIVAASLLENAWVTAAGYANAIAFLLATTFSYIGNTLWSFQESFNRRNARRFATTAGAGCLLAYLISSVAEAYGLHYLIGIGFVVIIIPALSFLAHHFWTYRQS